MLNYLSLPYMYTFCWIIIVIDLKLITKWLPSAVKKICGDNGLLFLNGILSFENIGGHLCLSQSQALPNLIYKCVGRE